MGWSSDLIRERRRARRARLDASPPLPRSTRPPLTAEQLDHLAAQVHVVRPYDRCGCKPGDGTEECPYMDQCYEEWFVSRLASLAESEPLPEPPEPEPPDLSAGFCDHRTDDERARCACEICDHRKPSTPQPLAGPRYTDLQGGPDA